MAQILIGTSGFAFRDWHGTVYPESLPADSRLEWYARHLPFVELNFTFYRMPESRLFSRMQAQVPPDFRFGVKAHRSLTHDRRADALVSCDRFTEALSPLRETGSLACTLFQFPFSFKYTPPNRQYLADLLEQCATTRPAVEFRHESWMNERVFAGLADRGVALVCPDLPGLKGLPQLNTRATSSLGYLRLHGRNENDWWTGTNETRYYYRYSDAELKHLVESVRTLEHDVDTLVVAFNNHFTGNAFKNALELQTMLSAGSQSNSRK